MVQFWAHKEVIFVHYGVLQFPYCAVFVAEDFDAVEVFCIVFLNILFAFITFSMLAGCPHIPSLIASPK